MSRRATRVIVRAVNEDRKLFNGSSRQGKARTRLSSALVRRLEVRTKPGIGMKSLWTAQHRQEILGHLNELSPNATRLWGTLTTYAAVQRSVMARSSLVGKG